LERLGALRRAGVLCDVELVVAGRWTVAAHALVIAAAAAPLRELVLAAPPSGVQGLRRVPLEGVTSAEAAEALVEFIYGGGTAAAASSYQPATDSINRDVLLLAQRFQLKGLEVQARWHLASGVTECNALGRLAICEEFEIADVREMLLSRLIANPPWLFRLATDRGIETLPLVMRDLLLRILVMVGGRQQGTACDGDARDHPKKAGE